jgi:hypothetical protein
MASVAINPPKTPVTEGSNGVATATLPNVCKMPGPPAPFVPTPLPNIGKSGLSPKGYSKKVEIEGSRVAIRGATFKSIGDIASQGTGGGLVSSNCEGPTSFVGPGSLDVKIEGKNVQLLSDPMLNNCGASGNPPNAATMTGILQASGEIEVIYGDDALCEKCKKQTHPLPSGEETRSTIGKLVQQLQQRFQAQKSDIEALSLTRRQKSAKTLEKQKAEKKSKQLPKAPTEAKDVQMVADINALLLRLDAEIQALDANIKGLNAQLDPVAVLRWDPDRYTYSQGYMVGASVCRCLAKKLAASSSLAPPGFADAVRTIGYQQVSPPAVGPGGGGAEPSAWECAAKQIMDNMGVHKPVQLVEMPFMPGISGFREPKGVKVTFELRSPDGTVINPKQTQAFKTGQATPSCDKCQQSLSALYCENKC